MSSQPKRLAIVIDSRKCVNCKACNVACRAQNEIPLAYNRNWMNEEMRGTYPRLFASFQPEQCHHCAHPACVRVCPTGASYQRADGVVAIKESDCVGCRYCVIACPYDARFFREDKGVVEKCDLCLSRIDHSQLPACVETCPGKVRTFGDVNDPKSAVAQLLATREYHTKKAEAGTGPQLYYLV